MRIRSIITVMFIFCFLTGCQKVDLTGSDESNEQTETTDSEDEDSEESESSSTTPTTSGADTIYIANGNVPNECTMWEKHLVIYSQEVSSSPSTYLVLLLSRGEFTNVYSANNTSHSEDAANYVSTYSEDGITGWHIPTLDEATFMRDNCSDSETISKYNSLLSNYTQISVTKSSGDNQRFLCDEGTRTFAFSSTGKIISAGKTVKYTLRPIKSLYFVVKDSSDSSGSDTTVDDDDDDTDKGDDTPSQDSGSETSTDSSSSCYLWNDHVVVKTDEANNTMLLISQEEWHAKVSTLQTYVSSYSENGLSGWRIPTQTEAQYLNSTYSIDSDAFDESTTTETLNWGNLAQLRSLMDNPIIARANKTNRRYICNEGKSTFSFVKGIDIRTAGTSTSYYMRLVKTVER